VCPSGPIMSCSSPSGPSCRWKSALRPGKPACIAVTCGAVGSSSETGSPFCWYSAYGCAGRVMEVKVLEECRRVDVVVTLDERGTLVCGYMP
jgi:hypothetical protein